MSGKRRDETPSDEGIALTQEMTRRAFSAVAPMIIGRVPFDMALTMLREAYIDAAMESLKHKQPDKAVTHSAIALLTGIDGRTIRDILNQREDTGQGDRQVAMSANAQVLGSWATHKRWQDPETGKPSKLTIYGAGDTFQALVKSTIGKSVSYAMVLDALLEKGNVRKLDDNRVELVNRFFRSDDDISQLRQSTRMLHGAGRNVLNRATVATPAEQWPRGFIWNQRVRSEQAEELRAAVLELFTARLAQQIGETLDEYADEEEAPGQMSANFGWFYWEDPKK